MSFSIYDNQSNYMGYSYQVGSSQECILNVASGNYSIDIYDYSSSPFTIEAISYPTVQPGEISSNAINLTLNTNQTFNYPYSIWFNVTIANSGDYKVYLSYYNTTAGMSFSFYDKNLYNLGYSYFYGSTSQQLPITLSAGYYYIQVYSQISNTTFNLDVTPYTIQSGESLNHSMNLPLNTSINGSYPFNRFYNTTVPTNGTYRINVTTKNFTNTNYYPNPISFHIQSSNGTYLGYSNYMGYMQDFVINMTTSETYTIVLDAYQIANVSIVVVPYVLQPGEDLAHAIDLSLNQTYQGHVPFNTWFNITITTSGTYYINLQDAFGSQTFLGIKDAYGNYLNFNPVDFSFKEYSVVLNSGVYSLQLTSLTPPTNTSFSISITNTNPNVGSGNNGSSNSISSVTDRSQSTNSRTTISLSTPFSPLEVILSSLSSVGIVGVIKRKRR